MSDPTWNAASTSDMPTIEEMHALMDRMTKLVEEGDRRFLRSASDAIEQMVCPVCGRKPTVTKGAFAKFNYVLCPHQYASLMKQCKPDPLQNNSAFGSPLLGVGIEMFDDGPKRF
jgi:hypothetical protein